MNTGRALIVLLAAIAAVLCGPGVARAQLVGDPAVLVPEAVRESGAFGVTGAPSLDGDGLTGLNPVSVLAGAGDAIEAASGRGGGAGGAGGLSSAINILVVLTIVSLAPSVMLMTTCFVRIVVVLGLLKQALGTQSLPPPQVIVGLALFMTLLVMSPTLDRMNREAIGPYRAGQISDYDELWVRARAPMKDFMLDQIAATGNWSSLYMVLNYRGIDTSEPEKLTTADVDMVTLVPAFMLSELKVAFLIGFKVYLPFLVIDMVIAGLLISMGMMMLPPVLISLPFKLLLFVLVDGWQLVVGSLMESFVQRPAPGHAVGSAGAHLHGLVAIATG